MSTIATIAAVITALAGITFYIRKKQRELREARLAAILSNLAPYKQAFEELNKGLKKAKEEYEKEANDFNSKYPDDSGSGDSAS